MSNPDSGTVQKVFQPNNDGPDDKILVERASSQHFYVYHDRPGAGRVGSLEMGVATTEKRGTFDHSDPLITWKLPAALTGHKYRMDYRVWAELHPGAVWIKREQKRTPKRRGGTGYDWRETARWEITHDGIEEVISGD